LKCWRCRQKRHKKYRSRQKKNYTSPDTVAKEKAEEGPVLAYALYIGVLYPINVTNTATQLIEN
jgi:hypothetical protein